MRNDIPVRKVQRSLCPKLPGQVPYPQWATQEPNTVLVAVPKESLKSLYRRFGVLFDQTENHLITGNSFHDEPKKCHWCLLYREPLAASVGVSLNLHKKMLPEEYCIPKVHDVVAGIITHYLVADEWLFESPVRTSSVDKNEDIICVGAGEKGIYVFPFWKTGWGRIGCAVARRPQ